MFTARWRDCIEGGWETVERMVGEEEEREEDGSGVLGGLKTSCSISWDFRGDVWQGSQMEGEVKVNGPWHCGWVPGWADWLGRVRAAGSIVL